MRYLPTLISHLLTLISHLPNTSDVSRKKRSPNRKWVISQLKKLGLLIVFLKLCVGTAELAYGLNHERLTIGITQFPSSFHPNIDSMLAKSYILGLTRRPLTAYDANWQLICMLCTTLPTLKNGLAKTEITPDGKQGIAITFSIHPKATWGDGIPVSSDDVIFTWKVGKNPETGVANMELYRSLYRIDKINTKTFTLHFDKLNFDYNSLSGFELLPAHIESKNFEEPREYKERTDFDSNPANPGLGFGPYRLIEVESGSHVVLAPNPTWYGSKPKFKKIIIKVIENTAALELNLLSGSIDMIAGELGFTIDQALAFEKRHGDKFNVLYKSGLIYEHIDMNLNNKFLADRRVRHALIYAIDRKVLTEQLFGGKQPVADTNVNPLDWIYAEDIPRYRYNPTYAENLLEQAGWKLGSSGQRYNKQGQSLRLEFMTTAGNRSREQVEQVLQSQWKAVGIDVKIRNEPARVFFGRTLTERRFTGLAMYAWISSPESVPRTILHSKHIPTDKNNFAGQNYTGFRNSEMDKILESIETELNRKKRRDLWRKLQVIYATELPILPLYFRANSFILPKWLKGIQPTGHQFPTTLWVEHWNIDR
ncbi:MAG: peptide ABC transporter [Rhodospirillaceae bacterium TMED8]|nr:peptide ABC transporter [Magnetovibrio sp.]OUT49617.1 MAG: peptide ABC transporter [Rhodospirillaceae bacterium TMED8]